MKERPILFSSPMVRALADGSKTQTRRPVKRMALEWLRPDGFSPEFVAMRENALCPYGFAGDRLWVRETWMELWEAEDGVLTCLPPTGESSRLALRRAKYRADGEKPEGFAANWKPSIHMPRWASRITLEVTGVRIERLQDISEADAIAEGLADGGEDGHARWGIEGVPSTWCDCPVTAYAALWESINGPGSWDANPFVWVVAFKVCQPARRESAP